MFVHGEAIKGELHSTDASAGVQVTLYNLGSLVARTLQSDEYLEIHSVELFAAATGDLHLFVGADSTPGPGETVLRGTVGNNSGFVATHLSLPFSGGYGFNAFVIAAAGVTDCVFYGTIRKGNAIKIRPAWRESLVPGA